MPPGAVFPRCRRLPFTGDYDCVECGVSEVGCIKEVWCNKIEGGSKSRAARARLDYAAGGLSFTARFTDCRRLLSPTRTTMPAMT